MPDRQMTLPLFFNLHNQPVLVIGGGSVAARKAGTFLGSGALVTVVAPEILPEILDNPAITCLLRKAETADISPDYRFVILATNDTAVNQELSMVARAARVPFNRCDDPDSSDFITGSTVHRGSITVAVVSGGLPTMSMTLKKRIEKLLQPELGELADVLREFRQAINRRFPNPADRHSFYNDWITDKTIKMIKTQGLNSVRKAVAECLSE